LFLFFSYYYLSRICHTLFITNHNLNSDNGDNHNHNHNGGDNNEGHDWDQDGDEGRGSRRRRIASPRYVFLNYLFSLLINYLQVNYNNNNNECSTKMGTEGRETGMGLKTRRVLSPRYLFIIIFSLLKSYLQVNYNDNDNEHTTKTGTEGRETGRGSRRVASRAPGMFFMIFMFLLLTIISFIGNSYLQVDYDDDDDECTTKTRTEGRETGRGLRRVASRAPGMFFMFLMFLLLTIICFIGNTPPSLQTRVGGAIFMHYDSHNTHTSWRRVGARDATCLEPQVGFFYIFYVSFAHYSIFYRYYRHLGMKKSPNDGLYLRLGFC
jgi:hypothetical protein